LSIPSETEFVSGLEKYESLEPRDAMYKVATFLVRHFWGKPSDMADGLGVLLLTWNNAFYRFGGFDFNALQRCIEENFTELESFRKRKITSLSDLDKRSIKDLFEEFYDALQISSGKRSGYKSPVSAAKALHLLAPDFFPLWDDRIAHAYGFHFSHGPAEEYMRFCKFTREMAIAVSQYPMPGDKSVLKLIDEYNYSKFTKGWITE
jgi:hypothetical protein